jgi:aminoglycoside phosphotransferase (APT) family kinase protein
MEDQLLSYLESKFSIDRSKVKLIGKGMESDIYKLDDQRILRVSEGKHKQVTLAKQKFYNYLRSYDFSFEIPQIFAVYTFKGKTICVENYLEGKSLERDFKHMSGKQKLAITNRLFDIAEELGRVDMDSYQYGDLFRDNPCKEKSWHDFLYQRTKEAVSVAKTQNHPKLNNISVAWDRFTKEIPSLPKYPLKRLNHGDIYLSNVMADENNNVTALIDFSGLSAVGDRQLDIALVFNYMSYFGGELLSVKDKQAMTYLLVERYGQKFLDIARIYDIYIALVLLPHTKESDPLTYKHCLHLLNSYSG